MSFHWKEFDIVEIDDLIDTIFTELADTGGWVKFDAGYNVIRDPNSTLALYAFLETTNKRFIQFQLGEFEHWNTSTHTWDGTDYFDVGHLMADGAGAIGGTDEGILKLSYDDGYVIVITDYSAISASYRRCCTFLGLADGQNSSDECLTFGSSLYYGTNATPLTSALPGRTKIMRNLAGSVQAFDYTATYLTPDVTASPVLLNGAPRMCLQSATVDKRMLPYIFLSSSSALGEQSGIRATIPSMFTGGAYDAESYGSIIRTADGKEYFYFIQNTAYEFFHFSTRLLVRCA